MFSCPSFNGLGTKEPPKRGENHSHEKAPVTVFVELAGRGDGLGAFRSREVLAALAPQAFHVEEEADVFGYEQLFAVTADRFPIFAPAEDDAGVHARDPAKRHKQHKHEREGGGESGKTEAGGADDHFAGSEGLLDGVEGLRVNLGIGIDEGQDLAPGGFGAAVARSGNGSFGHVDDMATARMRNLRGAIGRGVVGYDDFNGVRAAEEMLACDFRGIDKRREIVLFIESRDNQRDAGHCDRQVTRDM